MKSVITFRYGDLFESECQTLVNPVNVDGAMGAGLAKQFAKRYPLMLSEYVEVCRNSSALGFPPYLWVGSDKMVVNFPTKLKWRDRSSFHLIAEGLQYVGCRVGEWGITSIAFPALGCGCGGLQWGLVRKIMVESIEKCFDVPVEVYEPRWV